MSEGSDTRVEQLAAAKTGHEQTALQRQIDATDAQIDQLVYQLYELTPEEIKIIEAASAPAPARQGESAK